MRRPANLLPIVLLIVLVALAGCTPSPDSVCEHLIKLSERQWGDLDKEKPGLRDAAMKSCVSEKAALKVDNPRAYKCLAECVTSKRDLVDVADCDTTCGLPKKTPPPGAPNDEPETEGIPGLWTDPYADAHDDVTIDAPTSDAASTSTSASGKK